MQEDIIAKLIDFLVAPQVTTSVLLAEQEKVYFPFFSTFSPNLVLLYSVLTQDKCIWFNYSYYLCFPYFQSAKGKLIAKQGSTGSGTPTSRRSAKVRFHGFNCSTL